MRPEIASVEPLTPLPFPSLHFHPSDSRMKSAQRPTILVIEDNEAIRTSVADMLDSNGFQTVTARDGSAGLIAARKESPTLIITDIEMPGMTGFDLLEVFRADPDLRTVPVIVISAKMDRATMRRGMELGAADFITKPFTEDEVIHSVATRLSQKELVDELDSFAHTVAHDLKGPLCTLNGRLELAGMMLGKVDEATMRNHLAEALRSAVRLSNIIDELLVLAGVRKQAILPQPLDMNAVVTEAIDRMQILLQQHSAQIQKPVVWPPALGHAPWVVEVWANYISNAAKYGGRRPQITLGGESRDKGRTTRFWVQDHGVGLNQAALEKMFVPFAQIPTGRTSGHGLGLSIVRRIVEKLGGAVGVESTPGTGCRFWFELPAIIAPSPSP